MSDETSPPAEPEPEVVEPAAEAPPPPKWERKDRFRIIGEMRKVVNLTVSATESEITVLRRKLNKLTYGS